MLSRDQAIYGVKVSLQTLAGALWLYTSNLHISPDKANTVLGIGHRAIRAIFADLNNFFVPFIEQLSSALTVGGVGDDIIIELDEMSFRAVARSRGIVWLRYLAVVRRDSSLVWLYRLPYRISAGGGGPISVDEMRTALLLDSDEPVLASGSVCHTDGAKAYRNLASPLYDRRLLDFEGLRLGGDTPATQSFPKSLKPEFGMARVLKRRFAGVARKNWTGFLPVPERMLASVL